MGASEKHDAAYHGLDEQMMSNPPVMAPIDDQAMSAYKVGEEGKRLLATREADDEVFLDENSIADMLCDQFQVYTKEGGNDLQDVHVIDATLGGRVVTVEWDNGQKFRILVEEL